MLRKLAPPAAAAAAGLLATQCLSRSPSLGEAAADSQTGQSIAANYAAGLATSDGTAYTLEYLDRSRRFSVWRGNGQRSSFSELLSAAHEADVVMLGEEHHDAVTHKLQEILFARLAASRPATLSLEMFETDVQHVIDEYLGGLLREQDLMSDARPWANYAQYRPLVELAKAAGLPVVAANTPRRYVSAAGRVGPEVLSQRQWAAGVRAYLPPLPLPQPSAAYTARLLRDPEVAPRKPPVSGGELSAVASRGGCPHIGLRGEDGLLAPMLLWDATMAHAIAAALGTAPAARLVVHVCGRDHCLGISEMLRCHYCPAAVPLTVAFYPETDLQTFDAARHAGVGDFVVLTDEACNSDN